VIRSESAIFEISIWIAGRRDGLRRWIPEMRVQLSKGRLEMKKSLIGLLILVAFVMVVFCLWKETKPGVAPGTIVFDMKYRGLSGAKDELRYNSYWGFGATKEKTPFITEVRKNGGEFSTVYNSHFKGAEWSAVEVKDSKAVAFYFDLNADGKLSDNEKILPIEGTEPGSAVSRAEFVTPDFTMTTAEGHKVRFRALLQVAFYKGSSNPSCMWSPSCVLEGTSKINGASAKLILFTGGFTGYFNQFGNCSYALQRAEKASGQYIPRHVLSSIINHEGQFYHLKLAGDYEKGENIRATLERYTGQTGRVAVKLVGNADLKAELTSAGLVGSEDETIRFAIDSDQTRLPTGTYKLERGYVNYGTNQNDEWRVNFSEGPEFAVKADETEYVELGKPTLSVRAVDERKRYNSDVQEQTVFPVGTSVFISPVVKGEAGELYGRFSEKPKDSRNYKDAQPRVRIVDATGKEVAAATLEYG
jgi:hypothetical protein